MDKLTRFSAKLSQFTLAVWTLLASLFYGVITVAQVLGFARAYLLWIALPCTIGLVGWIFWRSNRLRKPVPEAPPFTQNPALDLAFWFGGWLLACALIVLPLILWPYTPVRNTLDWDAGLYHLPKAVELANTGSAWDFSIAYGEYPYGFESLFAFAALLTRSSLLFGTLQAFIGLYLLFSFWHLLRRYSALGGSITFFIASLILLSGLLLIKGNPWNFYRFLLYDVGMNDGFVAASLLAVIVYAPIDRSGGRPAFNLFGMAVNTMLAVSTKPSALLVLLPVWVWTLFVLWKQKALRWAEFGQVLLVVFPGFLWMARNLLAQGALFSKQALTLQESSILNNLANPYFHEYIPRNFYFVLGIFLLAVILALFQKRMSWPLLGMFTVLLVGFASTPASGFTGDTASPASLQWRFAGALMLFVVALIFLWISPWIAGFLNWISSRRWLSTASAVMIVIACLGTIWYNRDFLEVDPAREIVMRDQYLTPVGVDGYHSAYDYIQKNVSHTVVWVENGLPYFAFGPGFTNSVTRIKEADYLVVLRTAWWGGDAVYPARLEVQEFQSRWQLVYEDPEGRVYHRK